MRFVEILQGRVSAGAGTRAEGKLPKEPFLSY